MNKGKPSENLFNTAKNQEFELIIYITLLENLISPKLESNSSESNCKVESNSFGKFEEKCKVFAQISEFLFLKKNFSENPVNLGMEI